ncbi:O-antigen ligase family protein [Agarivorans aestuarii]|uniref:O-antigen ligase family protein n=1 Tax=Agarivorans aestuarii TaxID=1563703 RepID=UPI001FE3E2A6|nr:O-antigen ligase family protein [Agarivorans aestuarii]
MMELSSPRVERTAFGLMLFLIVWLPIPLASNRPWAWSIMEVLIATQSLMLVYCCRGGIPWQWLKACRILLFGLLLFQLFTVIQLVPLSQGVLAWLSEAALNFRLLGIPGSSHYPISLDPNQTIVNLVKGCSYLLLAINACLLFNHPDRIRMVMLAFVISGTFQAFYGSLLILSNITHSPIFDMAVGGNATGSFVYKNHFANYLILCLSMGLALVVADLNATSASSWRHRIQQIIEALLSGKMLVRLCMIIMVIGLVMSHSRMGNSAFFAITILGAVMALLLFRQRPRSLTLLFSSVLLIDVVIVSSFFGLDQVRERLSATVLVEEGRADIVGWSWPIVEDFYMTGSGAGSFYTIFQNYAPEPLNRFYDHAHNDYLQFVIESGLLATLILGGAVLWVLVQATLAMRKRRDPLLRATSLGCAMAIIGMLIHISVDFNLQAPANAASFIIILCLAMVAAKMPRKGYVPDRY